MRALLLSDIHANLEALEAVLADATDRGGFDAIWCLGDTVGYGPDPGACIARIREHDLVAVAGNHDFAAVGKISPDDFNGAAGAAAVWTATQLTADEARFLSGLPLTIEQGMFTLVHGSLRAPLVEYLLDPESAIGTLNLLATHHCLVGHSHYPFVCRENGGAPEFTEFSEDLPTVLGGEGGGERWIINPGGVGQPRDHNPKPSYGVFDNDAMTIERHRVEYDIAKTQAKMRHAGLPERLSARLSHGV